MSKKNIFLKNYRLFSALPIWGSAFVVNLLIALIVIAPVMIHDGGYFSMYYDFAAEQIPYGMLMNQAIKSGDFLWNWGIDLGGNLIEAFGFYGIGSPFLWLSLLFPAKAFPKLIGWILILKFAVAGGTSAQYLKRHIFSRDAVIFASVLYAFSGFQLTSILFYIFQDVVALFPLMLIGLEELTEDGKWGMFALACGLNALCNYVFFVGEVIFVVIYFAVKYLMSPTYLKKSGKSVIGKIGRLFLEGVIGVMMSGVILVPGALSLMGNARVGEKLQRSEWINREPEYLMAYLRAFVMPAENMCRTSTIDTSDLMTNSLYLPLVGMVLVVAYLITGKLDWIKRIIVVCAVIALIPLFNNAFVMFTNTCYRRWYYMFILMLALASGRALERVNRARILISSGITAGIVGIYAVGLKVLSGNGPEGNMIILKVESVRGLGVSLVSIALVAVIVICAKKHRAKVMMLTTCVASIVLMSMVLFSYRNQIDNARIDFRQYDKSLGKAQVTYLTEFVSDLEPNVLPYRYYINENIGVTYGGPDYTYYNLGMTAGLPSLNSFHSTIHPSILDFYNAIGITRYTPWTRASNRGMMELLGARYVLSAKEYEQYELLDTLTNSNGQVMYLYENSNALPLAFGYDSYMTRAEFDTLELEQKQLAMLEALVVDDADETVVANQLSHFGGSDENRSFAVEQRRQMVGENFSFGRNRFAFTLNANSPCYAFVSVPYDKHWKVAVDGDDVAPINVNGLMAVPVGEGNSMVEFRYSYTPVWAGLILTFAGILALIVNGACCHHYN